MSDPSRFVPLRTDPPPTLAPTLWIRSALALAILLTAVTVRVADVADRAGEPFPGPTTVVPHVGVVVLLIVWSGRAMANVDLIMPPTRYGQDARAVLAGILWVVAFAVPAMAVAVVGRIGSEFADVEALGPTLATIAVVLVALLAAWSPFRYHVLHAGRIGAPRGIMTLWFWAPLTTFVGGLTVLAFVQRERFGGDPSFEGAVGVGAVYGLAAAVFGWSTWRAITVFDEVIDLRWQRWKVEWEQTLADLVAQPAPPPER